MATGQLLNKKSGQSRNDRARGKFRGVELVFGIKKIAKGKRRRLGGATVRLFAWSKCSK
jgi:hypothetical protein